MRKLMFLVTCIFLFAGLTKMNAQDKVNGFAAVEGKGLTTTTGGAAGQTVTATTVAELKSYASSVDPYTIIVKGTFAPTAFTTVYISSNKTIVGYGNNTTLKNIELHMENAQNIIIRNLIIRDSYLEGDWEGKQNDNDAIQIDNTHHLWIDHCFLTHCGDGLIDLRMASDYVTISWTHLSNHNKAFGIGWTDNTDWRATIHHCWIDSTHQRNPSFDMGIGHLYNNYLSRITSYGNQARGDARLVVENSSYFKVISPLNIRDNGVLYSSGNIFQNCSGSNSGNTKTMPFDPLDYYQYDLDPAADVRGLVATGSGPQWHISNLYTGEEEKKFNVAVSVSEGDGVVKSDSVQCFDGNRTTITATPDYGWEFKTWDNELLYNSNPLNIIVTRDINLSAIFTLSRFRITTKVGEGEGSISPRSKNYYYGDTLEVEATPDEGWRFDHWEGALSGNTNPAILIVSKDTVVSAFFTLITNTSSFKEEIPDILNYLYKSSTRMLYIDMNANQSVTLNLYGIDGKRYLSRRLNGQGQKVVSLNEFKKGLYILQIESNGMMNIEKIVLC